jgi:protocatechuate 3,4-dioxygenase beta subunit
MNMEVHDHDQGLAADLEALLKMNTGRRQSLRMLFAGAAALPLMGCGGGSSGTATASTPVAAPTAPTTTPSAPATGSCTAIPEETGGPYPADGTNSNSSGVVNVLSQSGVVRGDIRSSFNGASGTAAGMPLTIRLRILNANASCGAAGNFAVYLWHCDREGRYSLYSSGVTTQNYLRGVQEADADGNVTFTTIFPRLLRRPHAARAFRGLPVTGESRKRVEPYQDLAIHLPDGDSERGVHGQRLCLQCQQPGAHQLWHGQCVQRWLLAAAGYGDGQCHGWLCGHTDPLLS